MTYRYIFIDRWSINWWPSKLRQTPSSWSRCWFGLINLAQKFKIGLFSLWRPGWGRWRESDSSAGWSVASAAAALRSQLLEAAARQNRVHIRTACGSGEQIPRYALFIRMRATKSRALSEPDRNPSQDLVPEPKNQVEKAEPWCREFPATRHEHQPDLWVHSCPPPSIQHRECHLSFWPSAPDIFRWAFASVFARWLSPTSILPPSLMKSEGGMIIDYV